MSPKINSSKPSFLWSELAETTRFLDLLLGDLDGLDLSSPAGVSKPLHSVTLSFKTNNKLALLYIARTEVVGISEYSPLLGITGLTRVGY